MSEFDYPPQPSDREKHLATLRSALAYLDEAEPTWILEPTEAVVDEPADQQSRLEDLASKLASAQEGEFLQAYLDLNLSLIRSKQAQPKHSGLARLHFKTGIDMEGLPKGVSNDEYEILYPDSLTYAETVLDVEQPNQMMDGLLSATGAQLLRGDVADNGAIERIYKGMFEQKPVYFQEFILPRTRGDGDPEKVSTSYLERSYNVLSEQTARYCLNRLSDVDVEVLESIGATVPATTSSQFDPENHPNRARMREIIELYAAMSER